MTLNQTGETFEAVFYLLMIAIGTQIAYQGVIYHSIIFCNSSILLTCGLTDVVSVTVKEVPCLVDIP